jgi:pimeloyl-ACP methyl ester carboxylesterase
MAQGAVEPFRINVGQDVLDDLRTRLRHTRWASVADVAATTGWASGTSQGYLRELVSYWLDVYDWRFHEARLNALPQLKARVGDADLHFLHVKGRGVNTTPLLLLHGWPDSFYRYHKVIPLLSDPGDHYGAEDGFDVVVPSLPGFAFTGQLRLGPHQPMRQSAELVWRLMTEVLGYRRFAVAGGDGGSVLAQILAIDHPESVIGIHLTDLGWHVQNVDRASLSRAERKYLQAAQKRFMADGAYAMVQTTQPRTLAPALVDSPVGLASWIVDRFHSWADPSDDLADDRDLDSSFSKDDLLTNIMLYWVTGTIGSSMLNYWAEARSPALTSADRVEAPTAVALYPKDIGGIPPRRFAERTLNVRRWIEMPRGGHFAALEMPEVFARDVSEFFRALLHPLDSVVRQEERFGDAHPII